MSLHNSLHFLVHVQRFPHSLHVLSHYSQGSNLSGRTVAFVAAASTTVAILFIVLGITGGAFIMSAAGAGLIVIVIVVYFVGAAKLTAALGNGNETGMRIITLTRQVAGVLLFNTLVAISYVFVVRLFAFTPTLLCTLQVTSHVVGTCTSV